MTKRKASSKNVVGISTTPAVKGYKVFNPDWTCNNYHYKVGETFEMNEPLKICATGFHFCTKLSDCFNYYSFDPKNKVAEIEALGQVIDNNEDSKHCTNKIHIVKELTWNDVLTLCNSGSGNSGNRNSGNQNSGNQNSGNRNSGNRNSGDWNSGDWNSGYLNSNNPSILRVFEKDCPRDRWDNAIIPQFFYFDLIRWISWSELTPEEQAANPKAQTTDGMLKIMNYQEAWQAAWKVAPKDDQLKVFDLPNFDAEIFAKISGIDVYVTYPEKKPINQSNKGIY